MSYNIDLPLIYDAISFYKEKGFEPISVPYIVEKKYNDYTKPEDAKDQKQHLDLEYIASAEQSFIKMLLEGDLLENQHQALTPCYRPEKNLSESHQQVFLKLELFAKYDWLDYMIEDCFEFFTAKCYAVDIVKTDIGYDIELNGIEIGSYGLRNIEGQVFTYGTGLAEPRFSYARGLNNE